MTTKAVHFVYLGESIPKYAQASLDLALRLSGLEVKLLGNSQIKSDVRSTRIEFTAIEDFYNPAEFEQASKLLQSDKSFRNGFWLKTLERFFVLEQYLNATELPSLFHAELDQLLFRNDILLSHLESSGRKGVFFPFHSPTKGVASVFFCNSHDALRSFIDFCLTNESDSEMTLLAEWASRAPQHVFSLPTLSSVVNAFPDAMIEQVKELSHTEIGGIVDAAEMGQWVGGIDPNNLPISEVPKNKFVNSSDERCLSLEQLQKTKFQLNRDDGCLSVDFDGGLSLNIYNLHLHSKVHKYIARNHSSIYKFFKRANLSEARPVPGARRLQLSGHIRSRVKFFTEDPRRIISGLRRRVKTLFNDRPAR